MYEVLGYIYDSTDHHFIPSINLIKLNDQAVPYYCDDSVTTLMMLKTATGLHHHQLRQVPDYHQVPAHQLRHLDFALTDLLK